MSDAGVSIHAPVWGATLNLCLFAVNVQFQSTLPYGERRARLSLCPLRHIVSIHAPVWGATEIAEVYDSNNSVSIHAPVWGATSCNFQGIGMYLFQSTLPYGERRFLDCVYNAINEFQSTLPYGERLQQTALFFRCLSFQSTLPYGERRLISFNSFDDKGFNPRSRMGSDIPVWRSVLRAYGFNPRSRMGSDCAGFCGLASSSGVSIHAPVWGATGCRAVGDAFYCVSIHAPVWGATLDADMIGSINFSFNPRSRMGSDPRKRRKNP